MVVPTGFEPVYKHDLDFALFYAGLEDFLNMKFDATKTSSSLKGGASRRDQRFRKARSRPYPGLLELTQVHWDQGFRKMRTLAGVGLSGVECGGLEHSLSTIVMHFAWIVPLEQKVSGSR